MVNVKYFTKGKNAQSKKKKKAYVSKTLKIFYKATLKPYKLTTVTYLISMGFKNEHCQIFSINICKHGKITIFLRKSVFVKYFTESSYFTGNKLTEHKFETQVNDY